MSDASLLPGRPVPVPDPASQPFFDACGQGRLLIKYCAACRRHLAPAAEACDSCLTDRLQWTEASGRATLYSYVVNHQVLHPGFAGEVPYTVLVVELEEGPRLNGSFTGDNADLDIGMPLRVVFEQVGDVTIPKWDPIVETR